MYQNRGMRNSRGDSKRRKPDTDHVVDLSSLDVTNRHSAEPTPHKKQKIVENESPTGSRGVPPRAGSPKESPPGIAIQWFGLFKLLRISAVS